MNHLLVEEDETARLLALQWSVASVLEPDKMRRARDAGTFFEGDGQSELPLQSMLSRYCTRLQVGGGSEACRSLRGFLYIFSSYYSRRSVSTGRHMVTDRDLSNPLYISYNRSRLRRCVRIFSRP